MFLSDDYSLSLSSSLMIQDKWRNMSLCGGIGSREKVRVPRIKGSPGAIVPSSQAPTSSAPLNQGVLSVASDLSCNGQEPKISPKYVVLVT